MKIHYKICENGAEIIRCFGCDARVVVPAKVHGVPVVRMASYVFSEKKPREETDVLVYELSNTVSIHDEEYLLVGAKIEEIILPDTVEEIGDYGFYGCRNMEKLTFSNQLRRLGAGSFNGCRSLSKLEVHFSAGHQSCIKEILGELWQRMDIQIYDKQNGMREVCSSLVFPEHYEEAVENTPARILFTKHHGAGNDYRQCFYDRKIDYRKYDELFPVAAAREKLEVSAELALRRLEYPYELSKTNEEVYEKFIIQYEKDIILYIVKLNSFRHIKELSLRRLWTWDGLAAGIEQSSRNKDAEILSFLMNEKHINFPKAHRKKFEL